MTSNKKNAEKDAVHANQSMDKAEGEGAVLAAIALMPGPDRALGERLHAVIKANAPALSPKLWYGHARLC